MQAYAQQWLASDTFLTIFLIGIFCAFAVWAMPFTGWGETLRLLRGLRPTRTRGQFSLETAAHAFQQYKPLALGEISRMRASYGQLGRAHKRLGYELGYPGKLDRLTDATHVNAAVAAGIAHLAELELGVDCGTSDSASLPPGSLHRTREALRHFVRDWSEEGAPERTRIFSPILDVLRAVPHEKRTHMRILVPGSGLGRLAWEISELDFKTTANELSYFMNLSLRFLLSVSTTFAVNQHTIYPYSHWFSHQRTNSNLFRNVSFPDVLPRLSPRFTCEEGDFFSLRAPPCGGEPEDDDTGYDYIVTLFFIDTSINVARTLEHIYSLLRPGGTWINLGPLLWTGGAEATLELSLDEVLALARAVGFTVEGTQDEGGNDMRARRTLECEYTADPRAMMRWLYQAEFWVATK